MIYASFDSNLKPVAEMYSGIGGAMLEACESDMNMLKAMLKLDAIEIKLNEAAEGDNNKESVKDKAQNAARMASGAFKSIMEKVAAGLEWLGEKFNQAVAAAVAQFNKILTSDYESLKKRIKDVKRENLSNITIGEWYEKSPFTTSDAKDTVPAWLETRRYTSEDVQKLKRTVDYFIGEKKKDVKADSVFATVERFFGGNGDARNGLAKYAKEAVNYKRDLNKKAAGYRKQAKMAKGTEGAQETLDVYNSYKNYRTICLNWLSVRQQAMRKYYSTMRKALTACLASPKGEASLIEFAIQQAEMDVDNMLECVITGCTVENLMYKGPERVPTFESHNESQAKLMESMSQPLF